MQSNSPLIGKTLLEVYTIQLKQISYKQPLQQLLQTALSNGEILVNNKLAKLKQVIKENDELSEQYLIHEQPPVRLFQTKKIHVLFLLCFTLYRFLMNPFQLLISQRIYLSLINQLVF